MLGKQLYIYQMNKDISPTMFFGQSMIKKLTKKDNEEISNLCKELSVLVEYNNQNEEWNPNTFNELCKKFEIIEKNNKSYNKAKELYLKIKDKKSLTKRFEPTISPFCEALNKGYWILIEQIESAPIEIIEKLIPLCGDNPELKIIKGTKEITYKRNNSNPEENINEQFRIFFTFNPFNNESKINSSLFNKCVVFTLPQVDSTPEYSAKIYYGSLKNVNYSLKLCKEISGRLSNVHKYCKKRINDDKIEENKNFCENDFTGRTIKFIADELTNLDKNKMKYNENITDIYLSNVIKSTFKHYYYNSFNISNNLDSYEKFKNSIINKFSEEPKFNIEIGDDDLGNLYKDIFDEIEKIKLILKLKYDDDEEEDEENNFNLSNFWNKCLTIKSKHLNGILYQIQNLIKKIYKSESKMIIMGDFNGLFHLEFILDQINKILITFNPSELKLIISDSFLLKKPTIQIICSKLVLYNYLLKDKYILTDKVTPEFLISYIFDFIEQKSLEYFEYLIKILHKFRYLFERFHLLFPFEKLVNEDELKEKKENDKNKQEIKNDKSISLLWLDLFYIYWKNKIHFTVQINKNIYVFKDNDNNNSIINPYFIFNESSGFYLAKNSRFYYLEIEGKEKLDIYSINTISKYDTYDFYQFVLEFSNVKKYIPTSEQVDEFEDKLISEGEEILLYDRFINEKHSLNNEGIFKQVDYKKVTPVIRILSLYFNYSTELFKKIMDEYFTKTEKEIYLFLLDKFDEQLLTIDYISYSELIRNLNNYFKNNYDLFEDITDYENISQKERNLKLEKLERAIYDLEEIKQKYDNLNFKYFSNVLENKKNKIEEINQENQNKILKENMINEINNYLDDNKNNDNKILIENIKKKYLI